MKRYGGWLFLMAFLTLGGTYSGVIYHSSEKVGGGYEGGSGLSIQDDGTLQSTSTLKGTQLISTVAVGTPPIVATSTTVVPNLYVARAQVADTATSVDISANTNLSAGSGIVLTGDALSHDTSAGYKHVPTGGTAGQALVSTGTSGTAAWATGLGTTVTDLDSLRTKGGYAAGGASITLGGGIYGQALYGNTLSVTGPDAYIYLYRTAAPAYATILAPNESLTANRIVSFPNEAGTAAVLASNGTAGQTMLSDGDGTVSWGVSSYPDNVGAVFGTDSDFEWIYSSANSRLELQDAANNVQFSVAPTYSELLNSQGALELLNSTAANVANVSQLQFRLKNSTPTYIEYATLYGGSPVITPGAEVGNFSIALMGGVTPGALEYDALKLTSTTLDTTKNISTDGKLYAGADGLQTVYFPNQTTLLGDLIYGNGGTNLVHDEVVNPSGNQLNGYHNTFIGKNAGVTQTTGHGNSFVGSGSGQNVTIGEQNTFLGWWSGVYTTTGSWDTFLGVGAGQANTDGIQNTFVGCDSGLNAVSTDWNTFVGASSGTEHISGDRNTLIGQAVAASNTTGESNTIVGQAALHDGTSASYNTAVGTLSQEKSNGDYNDSFGYKTLHLHTSGNGNVALGNYSLYSNLTGASNVAIGYHSGYYALGSNEFYLDNQDRADTVNEKRKSLLWGAFNVSPLSQTLRTNAAFSANSLASLGSNIVTNSTFDSVTTGWTANSATLSVASSAMRVSKTGVTNGWASQILTGLVSGGSYKVQVTLSAVSDASATNRFVIGDGSTTYNETYYGTTFSAPATRTVYFTTTGTSVNLACVTASAGTDLRTSDWDNITLEPVGDAVVSGKIVSPSFITLTANDTSPNVSGSNHFVVPASGWTAGQNITALDSGTIGQEVTILGGDTDCVVVDGAGLALVGNWTSAANATIQLLCTATDTWVELSRCAP